VRVKERESGCMSLTLAPSTRILVLIAAREWRGWGASACECASVCVFVSHSFDATHTYIHTHAHAQTQGYGYRSVRL